MRAEVTTAAADAAGRRTPRVFAQRGLYGAPPYSLPALSGLIAKGGDGIAVDVAATRDGVLVAADDALIRAAGIGADRVRDVDWVDLARVDFASAFGFDQMPTTMLPLNDLVTALGRDTYLALCFPDLVDVGLVDAVARCGMRWTRVLLLGPTATAVQSLSEAAPGALRVVVTQPWDALLTDASAIDGFAMDVRSFRHAPTPPPDKVRIGLGCNTALAAAEAWRLGLDIVFSERPSWLSRKFALAAARDEASQTEFDLAAAGSTRSDQISLRRPRP